MKKYTKDNVDFHSESGPYSAQLPAINVKVYHYPTPWQVSDCFDCSEEVAEQALGYALESAQERFWEEVQEIADYILTPHFGKATVYCAGRSGGWLVIRGIADDGYYRFENPIFLWDAIDLAKWRRFEREVNRLKDWLCSWEYVRGDIEANRWAEDGAEMYNYFEFSDGHSECIVDLKDDGRACPHCAYVLG